MPLPSNKRLTLVGQADGDFVRRVRRRMEYDYDGEEEDFQPPTRRNTAESGMVMRHELDPEVKAQIEKTERLVQLAGYFAAGAGTGIVLTLLAVLLLRSRREPDMSPQR